MNGLILAGGNSSRMKHNKALLQYNGQPQYLNVYNLLKPYCEKIFLSTQEILPDIEIVQLQDSNKYLNVGPVAGLLTAFDTEQINWFVIAIDYPMLTINDLQKIVTSNSTNKLSSVVYHSDTHFFEPFIGIYTPMFIEENYKKMHEQKISLQNVLQQQIVNKVEFFNTKLYSINTYNDYKNYLTTNE
jgi:molybdenum cofactor guanylyltransferase